MHLSVSSSSLLSLSLLPCSLLFHPPSIYLSCIHLLFIFLSACHSPRFFFFLLFLSLLFHPIPLRASISYSHFFLLPSVRLSASDSSFPSFYVIPYSLIYCFLLIIVSHLSSFFLRDSVSIYFCLSPASLHWNNEWYNILVHKNIIPLTLNW